ncbi:hypothetical protein ACVI1K_006069 [Bradyrhizobium sp. USDA 4508]
MPGMENPAVAGRAPEVSLAVSKIDPEYASPLLKLQAARLTRRCAISFAMAAVVAPFMHGDGAR